MPTLHRYPRRRLLSVKFIPKRRRICAGLTVKDLLTILSSLALPLVLGVFTIVFTLDQRNIASKQRLEDRRLADEQREQDLNISREQRREDRELAREHRLQDLNISHIQRNEDQQLAREHRLQDFNSSRLQRELERSIADETRNISEIRRTHELHIEDKRYRDALLTNYINEMSRAKETNDEKSRNTSLTPIWSRSKTLILIRQLDSSRNSQVIRFLHESGYLDRRNEFFLDLFDAELLGLDLSHPTPRRKMHHLHLAAVDLTGSSFVNRDLTGSNFSSSILANVNFSSTILTDVDFSYAKFNGSLHKRHTVLKSINFSHADLTGIDFRPSESGLSGTIQRINFRYARLEKTRFDELYLTFVYFRDVSSSIEFSHATFISVTFENITATNLNFSHTRHIGDVTFTEINRMENCSFHMAQLYMVQYQFVTNGYMKDTTFDYAKLIFVSFTYVNMHESSFIHPLITHSSFSHSTIQSSTFVGDQLVNCTFTNAQMSIVTLNISLLYVTFDDANLQNHVVFGRHRLIDHCTFRRAQMQTIRAEQCEFRSVDMHGANLTNASMFATHLSRSNLSNTDFTAADLTMVNLSHSNLLNARITDVQLHSAISIENTVLPNGTIAHDLPLIRNGNAYCNRTVEQDWNVQPPNSVVVEKSSLRHRTFSDEDDCMFVAVQSRGEKKLAVMTQEISVTRYSKIFREGLAELLVISDCNNHVKIGLTQRDKRDQVLSEWTPSKNSFRVLPHKEAICIILRLEFDTSRNLTATCDNIALYTQLK